MSFSCIHVSNLVNHTAYNCELFSFHMATYQKHVHGHIDMRVHSCMLIPQAGISSFAAPFSLVSTTTAWRGNSSCPLSFSSAGEISEGLQAKQCPACCSAHLGRRGEAGGRGPKGCQPHLLISLPPTHLAGHRHPLPWLQVLPKC